MSMPARQRWSLHTLGSTRRLAWVLALALLLPFAQALAWAHTFSHHSTLAQRSDAGVVGSYDATCAACLGAVPLHAGALPGAEPVVAQPPLQHAQPLAVLHLARGCDTTLAYRSRAPPPALT